MSTQVSPAGPVTKVITGLVRFSYLHIWEAVASEEGGEKKYSVSIIIPKSDTVTVNKIKKAIENAKELGKSSKFDGKIPSSMKQCLRDGDEERPDDEAYANSYFVNANSKIRPGVVDADLNSILNKEELYSGCYGKASLNFFAFNWKGNKGIGCGLNNIQKIKDGTPLGGRSSAESDFSSGTADDDIL